MTATLHQKNESISSIYLVEVGRTHPLGAGFDVDADIHIMLNMYWEGMEFELPDIKGLQWYRVIDTAEASPADIVELGQEIPLAKESYGVQDRSVVVLISK